MNLKQLSTAHQLVLINDPTITEILNISKSTADLNIDYLTTEDTIKQLTIPKQHFLDNFHQNKAAILVNVEIRKDQLCQNILISKQMAISVGLHAFKEFNVIGTLDTCNEINYRYLLIKSHSIKYKPLIEQTALCFGWEYYQRIQKIHPLRCQAFHKTYSRQFNRERHTISWLETQIMIAYETINFTLLVEVINKLDAIARILPYQFVEAVNRVFLEIIRNWLILGVRIPEIFLTRTKGIINQSHFSTFNLETESTWQDVVLALKFFQ